MPLETDPVSDQVVEPAAREASAERRRLQWRWICAVTIGESAGFAVAALVAATVGAAAVPDPWRSVVMSAGGAVEGAVLGTAQFVGMGRRRPRPGPWIVATAAGAAVAWAIGMLPSTIEWDLPMPAALGIFAAGGVVLLLIIPTLQWVVLRRPGSLRWIPINAGTWAIGLLWTFAPSPIVDETTPFGSLVLIYVFAGLLMAATVAGLTARTAARLFG